MLGNLFFLLIVAFIAWNLFWDPKMLQLLGKKPSGEFSDRMKEKKRTVAAHGFDHDGEHPLD